LQFSLQAASPETFGYTVVYYLAADVTTVFAAFLSVRGLMGAFRYGTGLMLI
jgi:hypothetical protein